MKYWWYLLVKTTYDRMKWEAHYIRLVGRDGFG